MPAKKTTKKATAATKKRAQARKQRPPARKSAPKKYAQKKCPHCPMRPSIRTFEAHVATHAEPKTSSNGTSTNGHAALKASTPMGEAKAVKAYLEEIRTNGKARKKQSGVQLGRKGGYTEDPKVVEKAIAEREARAAAEDDVLKRLKLEQQLINMRKELARLQGSPEEATNEEKFIANAASYGERQIPPIDYNGYRQMGVTAKVLKAAGIAS